MKKRCRHCVSAEIHGGDGCYRDVNDGGSRGHYHWSNPVMVRVACDRDVDLDERSNQLYWCVALVRFYPCWGGFQSVRAFGVVCFHLNPSIVAACSGVRSPSGTRMISYHTFI